MDRPWFDRGLAGLVAVVQELSLARDLETIHRLAHAAARHLTGADAATIVVRDGEDALEPESIPSTPPSGRAPLGGSLEGWTIVHRKALVLADLHADERFPSVREASPEIRGVAVVPIRAGDPLGAIGSFWHQPYQPTVEDVSLLQALADTTAVAIENVRTLQALETRVAERTAELAERASEAEERAARLAKEVEERRRTEDQVRLLSLTDPLTGVANRRGFLVRAEQARMLERRRRQSSLLLFADIDGLKRVNDEHGHEQGDRLLIRAASVLADEIRESDVLARWGGDEFVAFLPGTIGIDNIRERILERLAATNGAVGMSIGTVVVAPTDRRPLEVLLAEADARMYEEKQRRKRAAPPSVDRD